MSKEQVLQALEAFGYDFDACAESNGWGSPERIAALEAQLATSRALTAEEIATHLGPGDAAEVRERYPLPSGLVAVPVETLTKAVLAASCELKRTGHNSHSQPRAGLEALVPGGVTVPPGSEAGFLSIPAETLRQAKEALELAEEWVDIIQRSDPEDAGALVLAKSRAALTAIKAVLGG